MTEPEWRPPGHLQAPHVRRLELNRFDWERAIRGRLPRQYVAVALMVATYANKEGSNAHPGEDRLAGDLQVSTRTVRDALAALDRRGFLTRAHAGGKSGSRRGLADAYTLSIPAPLAAWLDRWDETRGEQWTEHQSDFASRPFRSTRPPEVFDMTTGSPLPVVRHDHRKFST